MSSRIPQMPADDKFSHQFSLSLLEQIYPREVIAELLSQVNRWEQRERKLSQLVMVYLLLAWHLFCRESLRSVFLHLSAGLRLCGLLSATAVPTKNAFLKRRKQLGVRFFRLLMRRVCRPRATVETPGAFAFGQRLVAIDGTLEDVADSPANARFFGRLATGTTASPYPQARCVYLAEVATHLIFDAIIAPCHASEQRLCWGLLHSITAEMLVLLDRGFVSGPFFEALRKRGAHVLARLAQGIFLRHDQELADGSYLTWLTPRMCPGLTAPRLVRVIEYFIKPEVADVLVKQPPSRMHSHRTGTNPAIATRHRLITTLLEPLQAPALDLCLLYHERGEIELCIDESKNHLRICQSPVLSHLPLLALQELYAILLTHYALRALMCHAAQAHNHLDPDRISFTLTLQTLRDAVILASHPSRPPLEQVECQVQACLVLPGSLLEPRRLRFNCRVVKRICTRFRRKRPEHVNLSLKHTDFADILLM
jgi:hypothetical protein